MVNRKKDDPYYDVKVYHYGNLVRSDGQVSALCYKKPRPINLNRGFSWSYVEENVTCPKCKQILSDME